MGCIASCLTMQIFSCCTSTTCACASKIFKIQGSIATRLSYAAIFLISFLLSWLMLTDWVTSKLSEITYGYLALNCPEGHCHGPFAVHRICFALALFHIILGALVWNVNDSREPRASIQNGWWGPKIFIWLLLTVVVFFIPNQFFAFWGNYIAIIGAALFILVQLALLIDFAHSWSESCIEKWENDSNDKWKYIVVGSSIGMYIIAIALIGVMYAYFGRNGCGLNQFYITFNLVLCILITLLSVHPQIQEANSKSGLSQASMVAIYCSYLILSAVMNEPVVGDDYYCNPIRSRGTRHTAVLFGALFTIVAIVYSTSRAATQSSSLISSSDYDPVNSASAVPLIDNQPGKSKGMGSEALMAAIESGALPPSALNNVEEDDDEPGSIADDEKHGCQYNYTLFHLIFAIGAMYVSMLLTNWNNYSNTSELVIIGANWPAVWVKVVSSWLCIGLYSWSLLGPIILPDRDWN